ncbi:alpha/beta hydrolase [soil metagenome]
MDRPIFDRRAIPSDARLTEWHAPDGWALRRFDWPGSGRGSILFQGGRGDIIEKYLESFEHWHAQGWSVTAFDWRGQGGSGRLARNSRVGHIDDFGTYIADLKAFWADWSATAQGPRVLMGHSMGGHLVLRALAEGAVDPDAVVLIAPMLGLHAPLGSAWVGERLARTLGGIGNSARPAWKQNEIPGTRSPRQKLLTHDIARYDDEIWWKEARPELLLGPPSWRWVIEAFKSTRILRANRTLKSIRTPLLALIADADLLVDPKLAARTVAKLPQARIVHFGKESAHEILREADPVRNRAIGEIDLFLAARAPRA